MKSGEERLREALGRHRTPAPRPPLNLEPTTPFEQQILAQVREMRRDVDEMKKRLDWLTITIVGAALTFILETLLS